MQAAVDSLLQAVIDVSSRGNGRDRDINVFVQRRYLLAISFAFISYLLKFCFGADSFVSKYMISVALKFAGSNALF